MRIHSLYSSFVVTALLTGVAARLMAQVAYEGDQPWSQRADSGPDAEVPGWYYNLGITGIRAELVAFIFTIPKRNLAITGKELP